MTTSAAERAAGHTYDAIAAALCVEDYGLRVKDCRHVELADAGLGRRTERAGAACAHVFRGHLAVGAECESASQCDSDLFGVRTTCDDKTHRCAVVTFGLPGEACGVPGTGFGVSRCMPGLACSAHAYYARDSNGECFVQHALGERCEPGVMYACQEGLTCDLASSTCTEPRPLGARCLPEGGILGRLPSTCAAPNECDRSMVCTAPKAVGEPCDPLGRQQGRVECGMGGHCDPGTGTCVARKPVGSPCTSRDECDSYHCGGGRCLPLLTIATEESCQLATPEQTPTADGGT